MDRNAYRDETDTGQPDAYQPDAYQPDAYQGDTYQGDAYQGDAYWRRRVITLCAGLALLGLLAWAFSGGGGKPAAKMGSQASGARPAAAYSGTPTPGADTSNGANASTSAGSSASGVEPGGVRGLRRFHRVPRLQLQRQPGQAARAGLLVGPGHLGFGRLHPRPAGPASRTPPWRPGPGIAQLASPVRTFKLAH